MQIFRWRLLGRAAHVIVTGAPRLNRASVKWSVVVQPSSEKDCQLWPGRVSTLVSNLLWVWLSRDFRHPLYPHCPFHHASFCTLSYSVPLRASREVLEIKTINFRGSRLSSATTVVFPGKVCTIRFLCDEQCWNCLFFVICDWCFKISI